MALPTDLGATDAGFLLFVIDYAHLVRWNGTAWEWAPGDEGNGFIRDFLVPPTTAGWQKCDGSVTSLLVVGHPTLFANTITTPDETSGVYHKSAATTDASVQSAVAPTISGHTGDESSHTHSVTPATTTVQSGAGATVATGATVTSGTGSAHHHDEGTLVNSDDGEPAHVNVLRYFRR